MEHLRLLLIVALSFTGFQLWEAWQKDYGPAPVATTTVASESSIPNSAPPPPSVPSEARPTITAETLVTLEAGLDLVRIAERHELSGGTIVNVSRYAALKTLSRGDRIILAQDVDEGIRRELQKEGRAF